MEDSKDSKGKFLGTLSKTYSTDGRISLKFDSELYNELKKTELVFIETDNKLVPFFIEKIEIKNYKNAIIKFHDYNSEKYIEEFIGCKVYLQLSKNQIDKIDDLVGFFIIDNNLGEIGEVVEFIDIPDNSILQVIDSNKKEVLIPYSNSIVKKINKRKKTILVNIPEGLIDINE